MVYGEDEQDILRNKNTVQKIYNSNYNFAVSPEKPKLQAVAGDRKVTLYWDTKAEESYDRFLKEYDFEGYKIYRATDPGFEDSGTITDGYGYPRYKQPLAIYDKVDSVFGFFPLTYGTGVQFNLGSETGLVHTYVDSPLVNGRQYFYAVTAYDKGNIEKNIAPSETNMYVTIDRAGRITTGENVVAVTPNAPALGYIPPGFDQEPEMMGSGKTSGQVRIQYIEPDSLVDGDQYELQFLDQSMDRRDNDFDELVDTLDVDEYMPVQTTAFVLKNITHGVSVVDTVWFYNYLFMNNEWILLRNLYDDNDGNPRTLTTILQGMAFFVYNPSPGVIHDPDSEIYNGIQWSRNIDYASAYRTRFDVFELGGFLPGIAYPRQYQIVFYDELVQESDLLQVLLAATKTPIPILPVNVNYRVFDKSTGEELPFAVVDATVDSDIVQPGFFSAKDRIIFFETLPNDSTVVTFSLLNNSVQDTAFYQNYGRIIGAGDTMNCYPDFPYTGNSRYQFSVRGQKIDRDYAKDHLDRIKVVPNPYVVTAAWEPQNPYTTGRGPRSIQFIHLPQKCTIRIFAVDGTLVRTLEHDSHMTDGSEEWDLLSKDPMDVAYGIYIYHIDAPGIGEKVGRILVIK
jgi:hypothetical protein